MIWQLFLLTSNEGKKRVKCIVGDCPAELAYHGSTTAMISHCRAKHSSDYYRLYPKELEKLSEADKRKFTSQAQPNLITGIHRYFSSSKSLLTTADVEKINQHLVTMVCKDLQPVSIVEDSGFRAFVKALNSSYSIPNRRTLCSLITSKYQKVADLLQGLIQKAKFVSITTDAWTSAQNRSYLTTSIHFIVDYKFFSANLQTVPITTDEKAETLKEIILQIMKKWNILHEKVSAIVSDNASNMRLMCQLLGITRIPCIGHLLNLAVNDAMVVESFDPIFQKCTEAVKHFRKSAKAKRSLDSIQNELDPDSQELQMIKFMPVRWNSRLFMLRRLLRVRQALAAYWQRTSQDPVLLNADFDAISDFCNIFGPVDEATNDLSGNYVTLSMVIPTINYIMFSIEKYEPISQPGLELKAEMLLIMKSRFKNSIPNYNPSRGEKIEINVETNNEMTVAMLLDQRYKLDLTNNEECKSIAMQKTLAEMKVFAEINQPEPITTTIVLSEQDEGGNQKNRKLADFDAMRKEFSATNNHQTELEPALKQYCNSGSIRNIDPLIRNSPFCEKFSKAYDDMREKYLCIPSTSTESERFFSVLQLITGDRRNSISADRMNEHLFLHKNLPLYDLFSKQ